MTSNMNARDVICNLCGGWNGMRMGNLKVTGQDMPLAGHMHRSSCSVLSRRTSRRIRADTRTIADTYVQTLYLYISMKRERIEKAKAISRESG